MSGSIDGFYAAYLSAKAGHAFAMLVFRRGTIVGVDAGGVAFDGRYTEETNNEITITLTVKAPPNIALIQGAVIGPEGESSDITSHIPRDFSRQDFIRINTKHGPVNAKLVKLRGFDE